MCCIEIRENLGGPRSWVDTGTSSRLDKKLEPLLLAKKIPKDNMGIEIGSKAVSQDTKLISARDFVAAAHVKAL